MKYFTRRFWLAVPAAVIILVIVGIWRPALFFRGEVFRPLSLMWRNERLRHPKLLGRPATLNAPRPYHHGIGWSLLSVIAHPDKQPRPSQAAAEETSYNESFDQATTIDESSAINQSSDPHWWVNSGGRMTIRNGVGQSVMGTLAWLDAWRFDYALSNPIDTDQGRHPQNLFRLVQRGQWQNETQEAFFMINRIHTSRSPNRNASNGILFFNRYQGGDTLYYAGVRVDGAAVIKKKYHGVYYTLDYRPVFTEPIYDRRHQPNVLPLRTWVGLRVQVENVEAKNIHLRLWMDVGRTGEWKLVAEATDDNQSYGGQAIVQSGHAGIRTDFMDIVFDDYRISALEPS